MLRILANALIQRLTREISPAILFNRQAGVHCSREQRRIIFEQVRKVSIIAKMAPNQQETLDNLDDHQVIVANSPAPVSSESVLDCLDDDVELLTKLRESYLEAQQGSTSKWLDYMKTCYIYLYKGGGEPSESMAAFDLDGTIIKPKSNKKIPKSATDWQFFSVWTKMKLQQALRENQARFVIFTNQNGVGLNIVPLEEVQERIELVTQRLNIPCTVFVAIEKDEFRKPRTAMFQLFKRSFNSSKELDFSKSFYCGDAVGYPSHSDADIKFAQTLGLPFLPPDKFVRGVKPKLVMTETK